MALPKVTPKTYDYGEYANPTPIRYKGGQELIGAAIGQAITNVSKEIIEKKQKEKAILDKTISDTYNRFDRETRDANAEDVSRIANKKGQLYIDYNKGLLSREDFLKQDLAINDGIQDVIMLNELSNKIDLDDVVLSDLKNNKQNIQNYLLQKSLQNGSARKIWDDAKNEWILEYNDLDISKIDTEKVKKLNAIPDEAYQKVRVPISEIVSNPKNYFNLDTRIDFNNEAMQDLFSKAASKFDKTQGKLFMTDISDNGYEKLNQEKATLQYAQSSDVDAIYNKIGKDIAEDILEEDFVGDEDQVNRIKLTIAQQIVSKADQVGNKVTEPRAQKIVDPTEERTGMNLQDRANAIRQIAQIQPGETFTIKFKGTNDFQKENYEITTAPTGQILFRKKAKAGEEPFEYQEISKEDLIKEFGVQDLIEQPTQTMSAQDLINKYSK